MAQKYVYIFIIFFIIITHKTLGELQGPLDSNSNSNNQNNILDDNSNKPSENDDKKSNERKSSKISESEINDAPTITKTTIITSSDDLNKMKFDFKLQDIKESIKRLSDTSGNSFLLSEKSKLTEQLQTRGMAIQKLQEALNEIDAKTPIKSIEPTAEEIEAENLYKEAMAILNKTGSDKIVGYSILKKAADMGHKNAKTTLAWAHLLGHSVELDIAYAKKEFIQLVEYGLPDAHMGLGFMYSTGIGVNVSQSKALVHYTMAALGDNTWAQMALGYRYLYGLGVTASCEKALEYYHKVAKKVASKVTFSGGAAVHRVRLLDELENPGGSESDLVEYYQLLADKGDIPSQVGLGQLYYQGGRTTARNLQKALEYFTQAANNENPIGYAFLGKIYLEGNEHIKADNDTAFKYFKKAADLGNPIGQSGLGIMYLHGRGVPKDTMKALNYFTQAADQGWVDGQLQLGQMYFTGNGVKMDFKMAMKYFNLASQSGHVLAYYYLGVMNSMGLGMLRSCATAVEFFKNVAERGRWSEKLMQAYHDYRTYHFDEAFMQYALLAEVGYEVAQSNAAFLLDRNEVNLFKERSDDLIRAFHFWKRAAAQGYSAAQVKLGDYYYYGLGTQTDYETAASLYRKASEQQYNAQAMFNLGYMHEQGLGMKKDWHLAKRLYDLAAETSADAKIPVALALMKLQFLIKLEAIKDSPFKFILHLDENIASNWDLYLVTILTLALGAIFYVRRPPPPQQQQPTANQQQQRQQENERQEVRQEPLENEPLIPNNNNNQHGVGDQNQEVM